MGGVSLKKYVNKKRCVNCGKCNSCCNDAKAVEKNLKLPINSYTCVKKNRRLNDDCASGGIATTIYKYCIDNDMIGIGVRWRNGRLIYDYVDLENIGEFAGSKYVQADMTYIFKTIYKYKDKRMVFIGLPCQVNSLKAYVKDKIDIIYIDLVCHGVCSQELFLKHLNKKRIHSFDSITFRAHDNKFGLTIKKGNSVKKIFLSQDEYCMGYVNNLIHMDACYNCVYARKERIGDLTLKDFCGSLHNEVFNAIDVGKGLSTVLVNTCTGQTLFDEMKVYIKYIKENYENSIFWDDRLRENLIPYNKKCFRFFNNIIGFENSIRLFCIIENLKMMGILRKEK